MADTTTSDVAAQTGLVDERPRLFSFDTLATGVPEGLPLLVFAAIAASSASSGANAIALGAIAAVVLGDVVTYRIRNHCLPPAPPRWPSSWGRHNRWTVPLFFIVLIVRAIQGI